MSQRTPYVYLATHAEVDSFLRTLYGAGYTWANMPLTNALGAASGPCAMFAKASKIVWIVSTRENGHPMAMISRLPFIRVNGARHLVAYMRETDRLGLTHA